MGLSAQARSHTGLDQDLHFQEPRYLGDINEFRVSAMQLVSSSLFQDVSPVAGPIVELSFDEAENGYSNTISAPISPPAPTSLVTADDQYLMSF